MPRALERHGKGEAVAVTVIMEASSYELEAVRKKQAILPKGVGSRVGPRATTQRFRRSGEIMRGSRAMIASGGR